MSALISCASISKSFSSRSLLEGISLSIHDEEKVGMIGPNGAGKSTLLKILAGIEVPDSGELTKRKGVRLGYLAQDEEFASGQRVRDVLQAVLVEAELAEEEIAARIGRVRSLVGFQDLEQSVETLSGGWRKRLSIAKQLVLEPDLLLLDEPTNHLDLEGIEWLEKFVRNATFAIIIISHDRVLLENVATRVIEVNRIYPQGYFSVEGNLSRFLEKREEHLQGLAEYEDSLRNRVRREIEWLRRGPKARTTKAKGRIQEAGRLIDELKGYESRSNQGGKAGIDFLESGRKTKRLLELSLVEKSLGGKTLFSGLDLLLSPGIRIGLLGANGSGKSTLLRLISGELLPDQGQVLRAPALKVVKFEQSRSSLDPNLPLKRALSPESDTVVYRERGLHVAAWAKRFLFRSEQLEMPVRALSGGEQARLLIAKLMLQPADILLLDEPTNDLDIDTLEVLEESLEEFPGALVLVTHDRFMLDRVSTSILALDGNGNSAFFASYSQAEDFLRPPKKSTKLVEVEQPSVQTKSAPKGLSFKEQKEHGELEKKIEKLEVRVKEIKGELQDPAVMEKSGKLTELCALLHEEETSLEKLVERWSELEEKKGV